MFSQRDRTNSSSLQQAPSNPESMLATSSTAPPSDDSNRPRITKRQMTEISWNPNELRQLPWNKIENFLPLIWLPLTFVSMTLMRGRVKPDVQMQVFKGFTGVGLFHGAYKMFD
mmetsp:Transcript_21935/g.45697  ORF Transcript_21935/g.45697 Transcript_21935/m.45697 type:complete len:114 (-) Transcript_21935:40-381(-)